MTKVVKMKGINKIFPGGVIASSGIDFDVEEGEIHALLGENGAGKTTLMNILFGLLQPDEGSIFLKGKQVKISSPREAINLGIGMVHQHFKLVEAMTVAENIILGLPEPFLFPLRKAIKKIEELSEKYDLKVNPQGMIWQLSVGEQQIVEILKILYRQAEILILDEPTSVLTPEEINQLFSFLKNMTEKGCSIIFITHKLREVMRISDRVTILRKGKVIATLHTQNTNEEGLAQMMIGNNTFLPAERLQGKSERERNVLEVEGLYANNDRGLPALNGISFEVREGEIFGVVGVAGNGQTELAEVITGLRKPTKGKVVIAGKITTKLNPRAIASLRIAHIPEDRRMGGVSSITVAENFALKQFHLSPFSNGLLMRKGAIRDSAQCLIKEFEIDTPGTDTPFGTLSGGNRQRVILARELSTNPRLIVAVNPTAGLDIRGAEYILNRLERERQRGAAILLISGDLDEIMGVSDRIMVICGGKIMGIVNRNTTTDQEIGLMIGLMMGGVMKNENAQDRKENLYLN